jgi:uncharacterized protein
MDDHQEIVLLFTRYPRPGFSKTRLISVLGATGAADLQRRMTEMIMTRISQLAETRPHDFEIHYDGGTLELMHAWLGIHTYKQQTDGHLGFRMANAMATHLRKKRAILLTGSDCPEITSRILQEALDALSRCDMVIGPACDGGYYLIGVNGMIKKNTLFSLFSDIPWGTKTVFADTMARAEHNGLTSHILPELHDIDRPEDLGYIHHYPNAE